MKQNTLTNLAIIMDGNGRWAKERSLARSAGHEKGAEVIREITHYCANHDTIKTLTLYAFSTENWKRPKLEVDFLMKLLEKYLQNELETYHRFGVRFETIGDLSRFSSKLQKQIDATKNETKNYTKLAQILALNYGARDEIVRAVKKLIEQNKEISEDSISEALDTPYSDIDLLIRTSGEKRISNFLLWQTSYSELFFTPTLWPDFTSLELESIIEKYHAVTRKFGGL
jgi:undecaprenyl diphosphate synthase